MIIIMIMLFAPLFLFDIRMMCGCERCARKRREPSIKCPSEENNELIYYLCTQPA